MGIVIDLIIVAVIAIAVLISVKRGFVKTAVELAGFILAIVLAVTFSSTLANVTYDNFISDAVETTIRDSVENAVDGVTPEIDTSKFDEIWDSMPDFFKNNAEFFGFSKDELKGDVLSIDTNEVENAAVEIADSVVRPVFSTVLEAVYSLLIFFIVSTITKLLSGPLNKLFSFSIVGKINKLLGGILGAVQGIIWASVLCGVINLIMSFVPNGFLIFTPENVSSTILFKTISNIFSLI